MDISFVILQHKQCAVEKVAMCIKMDLIALLLCDGNVNVYRTISWYMHIFISAKGLLIC